MTNPISTPSAYHTITPRIVVSDVAAQVEFLRTVFDAAGEIQTGRPTELRIGDSLVLVSTAGERDVFPAFLYVYVDDVETVYHRAVASGATSIESPRATPYGDRRAMVRDMWGNMFQIAHASSSTAPAVTSFDLRPVGWVESPLTDRAAAPNQADEGAPEAWLVLAPTLLDGLRGLQVGDHMIVITWLDRAQRDVLMVHPRGDVNRPLTGVFNTRSPDRPNPIGLHAVEIIAIEAERIRVRHLEALHHTPIIDIKPVLNETIAER